MDNRVLSIIKAQPSVLIRWRPVAIGAALMILLATALVSAQPGSSSQKTEPPRPETELVTPDGALAIGRPSGYVDGGSTCRGARTGDRTCVPPCLTCSPPHPGAGPFKMVGEGGNGVAPGGMLSIKGGLYREAVFLNKRMDIRAEGGAVTISPPSLAPFDLVADTVDDNGLPLNPKWGGQLRAPGTPPDPEQCPQTFDPIFTHLRYRDPGRFPCTNQFTYKTYGPLCGPHINWFGATYEGSITWERHSCPIRDDDDYTMNLTQSDEAGYASTRPNIHVEFDSGETIDRFNLASPLWWSRFKRAVDDDGCDNPGPRATAMLTGKFAIVTALMGFDVEHGVHVELHPVWALAMKVEPSRDEDLWAFFVRNWGNQGSCGLGQQFIYFPNNTYTFRLQWKPGATSVDVISQTWHRYHTQNPEPSVRRVPGQGVFVTFTLDPPRDQGSMWDGELRLRWRP